MTYRQIIEGRNALAELIKQPLHLRQAYKLSKIIRKVNEELMFFESEREKIVKMDLTEDEKIAKLEELLNYEIESDEEPLYLDENDNVMISANDLELISWAVEVKEIAK